MKKEGKLESNFWKEILNYRILLKAETMLCFLLSILSFKITGFAVDSINLNGAEKTGIFLFGLGIVGLATLLLTRKK